MGKEPLVTPGKNIARHRWPCYVTDMCGIAGILDIARRTGADELRTRVRRMADTLIHRGPDGHGLHVDELQGLAMAHRRLAIIDLSDAGAQPMLSRSGRFALVLNGEIYNFHQLRADLQDEGGPFLPWRGGSDTEVLLAAIEAWGVEGALRRAIGMFAFAVWDTRERQLILARDRMGEKPLYWSLDGNRFLFASELKALTAHPDFSRQVNPEAVSLFLRYQYVPAPHCIWQGVHKLEPGTMLTVLPYGQVQTKAYWRLHDVVSQGGLEPFEGSRELAAAELEELLTEAVGMQLESDVPLGTLLSGGIDSSLITALARKVSDSPVRTFTIGYDDPAFDESAQARKIAEYLGTEHTELIVSPDEALDLLPNLPDMWDEPFADASMLPTALVSRLTREHVTVCLSGDGGDETFGGYNRHVTAPKLWSRLSGLPLPLRRAVSRAIHSASPRKLDSLYAFWEPLLPSSRRMNNPGFKLHKLARVMTQPHREGLYAALCSTWDRPEELTGVPAPPLQAQAPEGLSFREWMQYQDSLSYLPGDILTKVDRAAMAVGLESRAPYLDHRVVEFAWRLPESYKVAHGRGKLVLRDILDKHVPRELTDRPKMGFGVPLGEWLRGPLRDWTRDTLHPKKLEQGILENGVPVARALNDHMSGRRDNEYALWGVLMLQSWMDRWN